MPFLRCLTPAISYLILSYAGFGAPPPTPTPLLGSVKREEFFSKSVIDDDELKNLGNLVENGKFLFEKKKPRPKSERPKSSVRTVQSDIPQRTFSTNFNKRKTRTDGGSEGRRSPRVTPREEKTMFPFPPRLPSRPSSPGLSPGGRDSPRRRSSNSPRLEHAGTLPLSLETADSPPSGKKCFFYTSFGLYRKRSGLPGTFFFKLEWIGQMTEQMLLNLQHAGEMSTR